MIRSINKDNFFLSQKAIKATKEDHEIAQDLQDTLMAHKKICVGMAANMIGYNKAIIIILDQETPVIMYNPEIIKSSHDVFLSQESCLSHEGSKEVLRHKKIKVSYQDENFKPKIKTYNDFTSIIIQHEIDHLKGILI